MMRRIVEWCRDDNCPRLVVDDETDHVYVLGTVVGSAGIADAGPGEGVVRMSTAEFEALIALYRDVRTP